MQTPEFRHYSPGGFSLYASVPCRTGAPGPPFPLFPLSPSSPGTVQPVSNSSNETKSPAILNKRKQKKKTSTVQHIPGPSKASKGILGYVPPGVWGAGKGRAKIMETYKMREKRKLKNKGL